MFEEQKQNDIPTSSVPTQTEPQKSIESPRGFNFKVDKNTMLMGMAILAILIAGTLIFMSYGNNVPSFLLGSDASNKNAAQKAIDYINSGGFLEPGQVAKLGEVSEESGIIKFRVNIGANTFDSYITKDGKLFFANPPIIIGKLPSTAGGTDKSTVKVSADDDPVLGSKDAPLTIVEFSDYECPFCKRHFQQVYPEIKKNYIDTGKVKLVYRDFVAVQAHNPLATSEAMAAECAREQGGNSVYFKYHDELFKRTNSNGNGLALSQLAVIAKDLGLDSNALQACVDSNKYKEEFNKDNADALSYLPKNDAGTPSFFIGKSSADGMIEGALIKGAQPYTAFQTVIEALLQ